MELFIIWLALAGVTAYFAKQKGRDPVGWFILGFIFPAVGLIAVWLVNPLGVDEQKSLEIARKFGVSSLYRKCPFCAEVVQKEAVKCKHCQSDIEPVKE